MSVKNLMLKHDVDIMAMAEMNLNWGKLRRKQTLPKYVENGLVKVKWW